MQHRKVKQGREIECWGRVAILGRMLGDPPGKVIFEPRHKRGEGTRQADILKNILRQKEETLQRP